MKKKILCAIAVFTLTLALVGCGGKDTDKKDKKDNASNQQSVTIDVDKLADDLKNGVKFKDTMDVPSEDAMATAELLYNIDPKDLVKCKIYTSTGATAEEVAVFQAKDADAAKRVAKAVDDRIAAQKDGFENYVPEELTKLNKPLIVKNGDFVILCITDDYDTADKIVKDAQK